MEFAKSREVLLAKKQELVEKHAKGNRSQAAQSITPSEEDLLFHTNADHKQPALPPKVFQEILRSSSPFFLAINNKRKPQSQIWYWKSPLRKNAIGKFLVNAAKAAGLPGNVSNHFVRKTCISRLMAADFPENYVAQLSSDKNLKSLDPSKAASEGHQRRMSMVLSRSTASSSAGNSGIQAAKLSEVSVQRQEAST
ncbi:hypothetical protein P5673_015018 [Acropora cervicornis]|uniref:Uncharacterized protein n=1 Tax=Acropora cervicornis TaxID=6130 RepID=A0AAD9V5P0_ACRCE|nr:hypothetical protein P5673_015018 [Acropora cervicornis]